MNEYVTFGRVYVDEDGCLCIKTRVPSDLFVVGDGVEISLVRSDSEGGG